MIKESLSMSEEKLGQHYLAALNEAFPGVVLDHAWQTKDHENEFTREISCCICTEV